MARPDYQGARSSNAGDDFHELWALRKALALLDQDTPLTAVSVEGLRAEDENGTPADTWNGVDCTHYFGGESVRLAQRIVLQQMKYSAANPEQAWTIARLTHTTNQKCDNSVIGRLAKPFAALMRQRPDLVASGAITVQLVSNQPLAPAVLEVFHRESNGTGSHSKRASLLHANRAALLTASGLKAREFRAFARAIDFSCCGQQSRFNVEERILRVLSDFQDADARPRFNELMRYMRRLMMPESKGELISRESILIQLGFSHLAALFPCPSALKEVVEPLPREASKALAERLINGEQFICLHGAGGTGKTTALQEVATFLPRESIMVVFDCYGGGRYLDSDAARHRPLDAFLQLSNDLARRLRTPLLITRSQNLDYPRAFQNRLEKASVVMAATAPDALLVIVVDAADNSVSAAAAFSPPERSFVHDFKTLGPPPKNVRFVITARTARLPLLGLSRSYTSVQIEGFTRGETAAFVLREWPSASNLWIDDFHMLSRGNPRVQRYALDYAGAETARALEYLLPAGKALSELLREQIEFALRKQGESTGLKTLCSGLIALPRPVPVADLSDVTGLSETHINDLCADLAPGIRLANGRISFADEEFEQAVRDESETELTPIMVRIADRFVALHRTEAYAATHIATALFAAGRGQDLLALLSTDPVPGAITDPVLRREVQLQRLRVAMKVCRESGNTVDAVMTLLTGAEALKTDAAIRQTLIENPDLAASFALDTAARTILLDAEAVKSHGPLLFHLISSAARKGDRLLVREGRRQIRAWLDRRSEEAEVQRRQFPHSSPESWQISDDDIAAETEALLRVAGPEEAVTWLRRWRPRSVALQVAQILVPKLIAAGETDAVMRCLAEVDSPWDLFFLVPLALCERHADLDRLATSLNGLHRRKLIRLERLEDEWRQGRGPREFFETVLTACEVFIAQGGEPARVVSVLEEFALPEHRRSDRLFTFRVASLDLGLRAHALIERLAGRRVTLDTYCLANPVIPEIQPAEAPRRPAPDSERREELRSFIKPFIELYDVRAQALIGAIRPQEVDALLEGAVDHVHRDEYRLSKSPYASGMRVRAAIAVMRLMAIRELDRTLLLERADSMVASANPLSHSEIDIFASAALDRSLHARILQEATSRARAARLTKASSEEKVATLVQFARLLIPISHEDAACIFNDAVAVAGEVNAEAVHEITLLAPFAERARDAITPAERRAAAVDVSIVVSDAAIRLRGNEGFPWDTAAKTLATLDLPFAFAAVCRWEDSGIVERDVLLPVVLSVGLAHCELSPAQVSALSPLLDDLREDLVDLIVGAAQRAPDRDALTQYLAKQELLRFGKGARQQVHDKLTALLATDPPVNSWLDRLRQATAFHMQHVRDGHTASQAELGQAGAPSDVLGNFNSTGLRFTTSTEIEEAARVIAKLTRESGSYVPMTDVLDEIAHRVSLADRRAHLDALVRCDSTQIADYELAAALSHRLSKWQSTPSVDRWCRDQLLEVVIERLPQWSRWLPHGDSHIPALLKHSKASDEEICTALIGGLERHVDSLSAPVIYSLVGLIGSHCLGLDSAEILLRYAKHLAQRIPELDRDYWRPDDVPAVVSAAIARLLFALMSDVDVRIRWRAAHAVRGLARLGEIRTLDQLVALYDCTTELSFRRQDAPFYWLAARLWLVLALDRIATEEPGAIAQHGPTLVRIATDNAFPHLLVRTFASSAAQRLSEAGAFNLEADQLYSLRRANVSPLPRKRVGQKRRAGFDQYHYAQAEGRRFRFDGMDVLPYWYSPAVNVFATVGEEDFLDAAERWIVDRWGIRGEFWRWNDEPRMNRFSKRTYPLANHSHGSTPTLERFNTHLEWNAMFCASGELLRSHALAATRRDDYGYNSFDSWLRRWQLSTSPSWLADLHGPKPLRTQLWLTPSGDIDTWVENVEDQEILSELGLESECSLVVAANHETSSSQFRSSVRVATALVSPTTASALVRGLQTIDDSSDYLIPPEGHHLEIRAPSYALVGWLVDVEHEGGIDERDPLRYGVQPIECRPGNIVSKTLGLEFVQSEQVSWVGSGEHNPIFAYEAWGDTRGDENEDGLRYDETVRSSGWRLTIDRRALRDFLNKVGLDLIVEIEVTRRNQGYGHYSRHDEKKAKDATFDRVVLLRRDGAVEDANGRVGTWTAPGA